MVLRRVTLRDSGDVHGSFGYVTDVSIDGNGRVYIASSYHMKIGVYDADGTFLMDMFGSDSTVGQFRFPVSVEIGTDGTVYVGDYDSINVSAYTVTLP